MAKKLNIYACSGIGDAPQGRVKMYDYWTDNTNTLSNTQAVNGLLADINLLMAEVEYIARLTDKEVVERLNKIDLLVVSLDAAQNYAHHYIRLDKAGRVIGAMIADGMFVSNALDNETRDEHLDELLAYFNSAMQGNDTYPAAGADFSTWWQDNVVTKNQIGLSAQERTMMQSALSQAVSGVGDADWLDDEDLSKYLSDAGTYFLYTFFTKAQLNKIPVKNRPIFTQKKENQLYTYNFCYGKFVGIYGSEEKYKEIIRTGIVAQFGDQPEAVCEDIASGNRSVEGIGIAASIIVAIISAIATVLIAVISAICDAVARAKEAKYAALDKSIVEAGTPNPEDFAGMTMSSGLNTAGTTSKLPLLIGLGAAAVYLIRKKSKKSKK